MSALSTKLLLPHADATYPHPATPTRPSPSRERRLPLHLGIIALTLPPAAFSCVNGALLSMLPVAHHAAEPQTQQV